jgi:hypothetical protein
MASDQASNFEWHLIVVRAVTIASASEKFGSCLAIRAPFEQQFSDFCITVERCTNQRAYTNESNSGW